MPWLDAVHTHEPHVWCPLVTVIRSVCTHHQALGTYFVLDRKSGVSQPAHTKVPSLFSLLRGLQRTKGYQHRQTRHGIKLSLSVCVCVCVCVCAKFHLVKGSSVPSPRITEYAGPRICCLHTHTHTRAHIHARTELFGSLQALFCCRPCCCY